LVLVGENDDQVEYSFQNALCVLAKVRHARGQCFQCEEVVEICRDDLLQLFDSQALNQNFSSCIAFFILKQSSVAEELHGQLSNNGKKRAPVKLYLFLLAV
jgi:hypothetical protein